MGILLVINTKSFLILKFLILHRISDIKKETESCEYYSKLIGKFVVTWIISTKNVLTEWKLEEHQMQYAAKDFKSSHLWYSKAFLQQRLQRIVGKYESFLSMLCVKFFLISKPQKQS